MTSDHEDVLNIIAENIEHKVAENGTHTTRFTLRKETMEVWDNVLIEKTKMLPKFVKEFGIRKR